MISVFNFFRLIFAQIQGTCLVKRSGVYFSEMLIEIIDKGTTQCSYGPMWVCVISEAHRKLLSSTAHVPILKMDLSS